MKGLFDSVPFALKSTFSVLYNEKLSYLCINYCPLETRTFMGRKEGTTQAQFSKEKWKAIIFYLIL